MIETKKLELNYEYFLLSDLLEVIARVCCKNKDANRSGDRIYPKEGCLIKKKRRRKRWAHDEHTCFIEIKSIHTTLKNEKNSPTHTHTQK